MVQRPKNGRSNDLQCRAIYLCRVAGHWSLKLSSIDGNGRFPTHYDFELFKTTPRSCWAWAEKTGQNQKRLFFPRRDAAAVLPSVTQKDTQPLMKVKMGLALLLLKNELCATETLISPTPKWTTYFKISCHFQPASGLLNGRKKNTFKSQCQCSRFFVLLPKGVNINLIKSSAI